jgi:two-component system, OmpR family, sensor histidine kinase KdpD
VRRWQPWLIWAGVLAAVTLVLLAFRGRLDKAHVALLYLLVVLPGTLHGGRRLGLALATVAFFLFNFFFLQPYGTFGIADPLDWLVLLTFLVVSTVAAQMLHRLQLQAALAERRAADVDRFATLGAETLSVARADEALAAIENVIRSTLELRVCRIHVRVPGGDTGSVTDPLVVWVGENGTVAVRHADGTVRLSESLQADSAASAEAQALFLPLRVRDRTVGVLELGHDQPISFTTAQRSFLAALTYYAALGVERTRLTAEADRAEVLREADRLKDALIASVSHDLRTPLTTIKALAHDLAVIDDRAITIEEEADRLNRLVADLLELSRIQAGALPLSIELNAVDDLVGALVQRVSGAVQGREMRVSLDEGGTLLVGRFDFVHALRILVNLVENAHKYSPPGTPIDVTVNRVGEELRLAVADQGPGVPEAERDRIFQAFYRQAGTAPDVGGTGLGLAIARRLAEVQGGVLTHAARPGGGSVFTLALPAADLPTADLPATLG